MTNEKLEKIAKSIFNECKKDNEPVTIDEAFEMAKMELNAKKNFKLYELDKTKKRTIIREKKIDEDKLQLIQDIKYYLNQLNYIKNETIKIVNDQKEITFDIEDNNFSINLIKHRKRGKKNE